MKIVTRKRSSADAAKQAKRFEPGESGMLDGCVFICCGSTKETDGSDLVLLERTARDRILFFNATQNTIRPIASGVMLEPCDVELVRFTNGE